MVGFCNFLVFQCLSRAKLYNTVAIDCQIGEQGGRPVYQNNATKEFLFFRWSHPLEKHIWILDSHSWYLILFFHSWSLILFFHSWYLILFSILDTWSFFPFSIFDPFFHPWSLILDFWSFMSSEKGAEWLVGPDFSSSHGGLQIFGNDDKQCPERCVIEFDILLISIRMNIQIYSDMLHRLMKQSC